MTGPSSLIGREWQRNKRTILRSALPPPRADPPSVGAALCGPLGRHGDARRRYADAPAARWAGLVR